MKTLKGNSSVMPERAPWVWFLFAEKTDEIVHERTPRAGFIRPEAS